MSAMNKTLVIATVLMAAALTGIFSAHPMAAYADRDYDGGDSSETNTEQKIKQKNIGGDASTNFNCADNSIDGATEDGLLDIDAQVCGTVDVEVLDAILGAAE